MAAAAPAVLLQAGYSRDMERDADEFAWRWLDARHIGRQTLTMLLTRIEARSGTGEVPSILSTHPSLRQRADSARRR
jgi:predicted Zn-dependent protease